MKTLVISNFYPPVHAWGYTQWCGEVASWLEQHGHEVHVLTSLHESSGNRANGSVRRELFLETDLEYYSMKHFFLNWVREDEQNKRITTDAITELDPDIVFIWGMYGLSRSVPAIAESLLPQRVVYYISDHWPGSRTLHEQYWHMPTRRIARRPAKAILRFFATRILRSRNYPPTLKFAHSMVVSEAVKEELCRSGLPLDDAVVVHGGSDPRRYLIERDEREEANDVAHLRLLYAGFLAEHKGVHTAIEAMGILTERESCREFTLSIVGSGRRDYEARLLSLAKEYGLESRIQFVGRVEPHDMPAVLAAHDVLVFPSVYEEPFARMLQEAMLAGLVIVGTVTGGTGEILCDEVTGLTFAAGDPLDLANQLERLVLQPQIRAELAKRAKDLILERFTLDRMASEIESYLFGVVETPTSEQCRNLHTCN